MQQVPALPIVAGHRLAVGSAVDGVSVCGSLPATVQVLFFRCFRLRPVRGGAVLQHHKHLRCQQWSAADVSSCLGPNRPRGKGGIDGAGCVWLVLPLGIPKESVCVCVHVWH
jgi:hypothetical protein